jgi:hypothetical protein
MGVSIVLFKHDAAVITSQDAFEGNELAAVRGRPAAARQPDTLP